jgi:threonine/homoserine/homoserine lactone efflux protein
MAWMGLRLLRSAVRPGADADSEAPPARAGGGHWAAWRTGLLTNLLNPKIGAFYVAVLPQFLPPGASPLGMGVLLALVHDVLGLVWFALLITAASAMRGALGRPAARRGVDALTGTALVGFGVKLGLTSR